MAEIWNVDQLPQMELYQNFFAQNQFLKDYIVNHCIYNTWWTGKGVSKDSDSSCSFVYTKDKTKDKLRDEIVKTIKEDVFHCIFKLFLLSLQPI